MMPPWTRRLTILLSIAYAVMGTLEVVLRLGDPDLGAMAFLGGTQLLGAGLILGGLFGPFRESLLQKMIIAGALAGLIAAVWTIVIPILAVTVLFLNLRGSGDSAVSTDH